MIEHSGYKKCMIFLNNKVGHYLKWTAYVEGHWVSADTLQGIKSLITSELKRILS